ncbi:ABC transporter ATP-binding protein [Candidatus Gracilibacteria bacterium CG17_big_fil_post_rev_8_21_14_2_50_48_13]|nr:MAG: ABC transporter ATP-binding protein [Candidatus Gracilibacteria bacterium CG17_big_fil_post_rev_8_21_14_2_50_48_13]
MRTQPRKPAPLKKLLRPYRTWLTALFVLTLLSNGLNLWIPQIISQGIDTFASTSGVSPSIFWQFFWFMLLIFALGVAQGILQSLLSEKVAFHLRRDMAEKISRQPYAYIEEVSSAKLMTHMTADVDAVKSYIAMAVVAMNSAYLIIGGSALLLLWTNWGLAFAVLTIVPLIAATFMVIFKQLGPLFRKTRENMDALGAVISESILGAALVRVLHVEKQEQEKFTVVNRITKETGMRILHLFSAMIPLITFISNGATIILLLFGGHLVIQGSMTLGQLSAFMSYVMLFIFPIISLGFLSNFAMQATASYNRISEVLDAPEPPAHGGLQVVPKGSIAVRHLSLKKGDKQILKDISFAVEPGSKTAIVGPTAAGKTQLLQILCGLTAPTEGDVLYDDKPLSAYDPEYITQHIGFVFQDSVIFNTTLAENIGFQTELSKEAAQKALSTAELSAFIEQLPEGVNTMVSERGASLSGGQKQRLMLARALAQNPKILMLDDFTARVDGPTQARILANLHTNYPDVTIINITQNIASVLEYDQILVLMEGELLGIGTHEGLLTSCPEYAQMYTSQQSTHHYELHA